jgi:cardiolipin synthase
VSELRHTPRRVFRFVALFVVASIILLFAFVGFRSLFRPAPSASVSPVGDPEGPPAIADPEFGPSVGLLTGTQFQTGNQVDLLVSGQETYPALWQSMRAAKHTITAQLYYIEPGRLSDSLTTVLMERARAGVQTYLLKDAIGAALADSTVAELRSAGVHVATFRAVRWWTLHKAQNRSHVRAVIVDGAVGFTGGFGIDDRWDGDGRHKDQWRDTNVRIRGPAVEQLQAAFDRAWTEATGQLLVGELFFPAAAADTLATPAVKAAIMHSMATFGPTANARLLALAMAGARRTLYISNAYFVPDGAMLRHLRDAARRGVDVRLLLPGPDTDVPLTRYAARSWYETLIQSGVKVYEYQPSMLHAKTFVVDGMFASVGSMNLDFRSIALNDEVTLLVLDQPFAARMDSLYRADLQFAKQIDLATFRRRGSWQKIKERFARGVGRLL